MAFDLVVYLIGIGAWESFHRRPMLEAMAKNLGPAGRIVCISHPVSPLADMAFDGRRLLRWLRTPHLYRASTNLFVWYPAAPICGKLADRIGARRLHEEAVAASLRRTLQRLGFSQSKRVSWFYRPEQVGWVGLADENFAIYECYDEYREQVDGSTAKKMVRNEEALLSSARVVFTTSRSLYHSRRAVHPQVYYAPNGVDYDLFSAAQSRTTPVAEDLRPIPRPRIGYVGTVTAYAEAGILDTDLLLRAAVARPDWSIVLIGPVGRSSHSITRRRQSRGLAALSRQKNVYLLGNRPYLQLPNYLAGIDVAIMPFCLNNFIHNSNPLKLWQYLAAGRPVVSTPFHEVTELADIVHLARGPTEFVSALERALTARNPDQIARGVALASEHSWDCLTQRMLDTLSRTLC